MSTTITIKTLQGVKFTVEVPPTSTILAVKTAIQATKGDDFPSTGMKLIHSGKVLKDTDIVNELGFKATDFLVMMVSKKKAVAAPVATPAPVVATTPAAASPATPAPVAAPVAAAAAPVVASPAAPPAAQTYSTPALLSGLTAMGFPESQCTAALEAAFGDANVAVEYLMNGIPEGLGQQQQLPPAPPVAAPAAAAASAAASTSAPAAVAAADPSNPLAALRSHPQFLDLRRLVQSNPSALQAVLQEIGTQQPELLTAINNNQAEFIRMMNEPIPDTPVAPPAAPVAAPRAGGMPGMPGMPGGGSAAEMTAMLNAMPLAQRTQMAQMMGLTPEQLTQATAMIANMPEGELEAMMGGVGGRGGMPPGGAGGAPGAGGGHEIRLTREEMDSVNRLTEMGFDRNEAAQAYLACDKNEALAANLLMDGGFGGGWEDPPAGGGGPGGDDMYD